MAALVYFLAGLISAFIYQFFLGYTITGLIESLIPISGIGLVVGPFVFGLMVLIIGVILENIIK